MYLRRIDHGWVSYVSVGDGPHLTDDRKLNTHGSGGVPDDRPATSLTSCWTRSLAADHS